ncbi:MAG: hypothetical protein LC624_11010, partial [Halobacteriales archaeon]|nr:hypothetical protein [Halobacteriales archaeon]
GDGLAQPGPGHYRFTTKLDPGVHYLLARSAAGQSDGLLPILAEPVQVVPRAGDVLIGVDPGAVEVSVQFQGQPVKGGTLRALDPHGEEVAASQVVLGKASLALTEPAGQVRFEFKPQGAGSSFAPAEGQVRAVAPRVALEPSEVPLAAPTKVRVVVDDPLQGPRADAPVTVERDGKVVARGATDATGASIVSLTVRDAGPLVVKAGGRIVGMVDAKPGLRLWLEPGPHVQGQAVRVRTLLLGHEPQAVAGVHLLLNGRDVGTTDAKGELRVQFGVGGSYTIEARKDGYVAQVQHEDVAGSLAGEPMYAASNLAAGHAGPASAPPATLQVPPLTAGQPATVRAWVQNPDSLPRVVRAELRFDGEVVAAKAVEVAAGSGQWALLTFTPISPGSHTLAGPGGSAAVRVQGSAVQPVKAGVPGFEPWWALGAVGVALLAARRR